MGLGAWEVAPREPKICIGIPTWDCTVSIHWARALKQMDWPPGTDSFIITGLPIGQARNRCVQHVLDSGYDYLAFWDSDVVPPPEALKKLLARNLDIVSALYYTRHNPIRPVAYNSGVNGQGQKVKLPLPQFQFGDLLEVHYVGMGFCLIHRRVLEYMKPPWFEWTLDVHQDGCSEDFSFCELARSLGFKVWLDSSIQCEHELRAIATYRGLEMELL